MLTEKSSKILRRMIGLVLVVLLGINSASANDIYVDAGGPYEAEVGEEIEFDASASFITNGCPIEGYYWDWGDGHKECFSGPKATHTWHSAFKGEVRVYIFYEGGVDWDKAQVEVTGPETQLVVTLHSDADLHLFGPSQQHVGINYDTGFYEMGIAGAELQFVPGSPGVVTQATSDKLKMVPQIAVPLYDEGPYTIEMLGTADGAVELCVQGMQDGVCVSETIVTSDIFDEESILMEVTACCEGGALTLDCSTLTFCPELKVDPDDIEVTVLAGATHTVEITLSEEDGQRPVCGVSLICSDLTNDAITIKGMEIRFSRNNIDIEAGGEETVLMSIPVPDDFAGQVTGTLTVRCAGDDSQEIPVTVRKAGLHAPVCEAGGPYWGVVGAPVTFDAGGSYDPDGSIEEYCWDWDLDGTFECVEEATIEHTWYSPYVGVIALRVVDDDGRTTTQYVPVTIVE